MDVDKWRCHKRQGGRGAMILRSIKTRSGLQFGDILGLKQAITTVERVFLTLKILFFIETFMETEQLKFSNMNLSRVKVNTSNTTFHCVLTLLCQIINC